ncbi:hypothetical protein F8M41_024545 [Gigaspora margarita]|uniref:Uncharacterized protein n=1 Tax=Gigaspora margarita TaxID=4874 RepID=A0A8H3XNM2_GIGMA|nr:hypothetical protein F8M41_024545 [Gigaspora margarita]
MTNKQKPRNNNISRSDSTTSESSAETIGAADNQGNEVSTASIEPGTRSYIDSTIQAATVSLMQQIQQFINQQAETQRQWNAQLLETINQRLAHVEQPNVNNNNQTESNPNNIQLGNNQQRIINSRDNDRAAQDNYPPTPVINSLLIASGAEDQGTEPAEKSETISYKATNRKFPSFIYTFRDNTHTIQGFINEKAIETEQIHLCCNGI